MAAKQRERSRYVKGVLRKEFRVQRRLNRIAKNEIHTASPEVLNIIKEIEGNE